MDAKTFECPDCLYENHFRIPDEEGNLWCEECGITFEAEEKP